MSACPQSGLGAVGECLLRWETMPGGMALVVWEREKCWWKLIQMREGPRSQAKALGLCLK